MACPVCSANLLEITLNIAGNDLTMHSCSHCETRWWDRSGEKIQLQGILEIASMAHR